MKTKNSIELVYEAMLDGATLFGPCYSYELKRGWLMASDCSKVARIADAYDLAMALKDYVASEVEVEDFLGMVDEQRDPYGPDYSISPIHLVG